MHWLIKPSGHLPCASSWPLLGIQSPAETEIKANNVLSIILQKSSCNYFVNCHPFDINLPPHREDPTKTTLPNFAEKMQWMVTALGLGEQRS